MNTTIDQRECILDSCFVFRFIEDDYDLGVVTG